MQKNAINMESTVANVKALYYIMQSMEGKLGGGEGIEGLYGSITRSGMQKILDSLAKHSHLSNSSHIVDVGAGLGRPLLHALVSPGVASGFGIEIDRIKCNKAAAFLEHSVKQLAQRASGKPVCVPKIQCSSIEKIASLDPATHAYSFWEGVPVEGKCAFGSLFSSSKTLQSVAVVQRAMRGQAPTEEMEEMGFGKVCLADSFAVSMSGSGRSFTAYVFNKHPQQSARTTSPMQPATPSGLETNRRDSLDSAETSIKVASFDIEEAALQKQKTPLPDCKTARTRLRLDVAAGATPRSSGVSGRPQRISTPEQNNHPVARLLHAPPASQANSAKQVVLGSRRSRRLQEQKNSQQLSSPTKPAGASKRVQKPKSPAKLNLDAAGFKIVRGRAAVGAKGSKPLSSNIVIQARGLATASELR